MPRSIDSADFLNKTALFADAIMDDAAQQQSAPDIPAPVPGAPAPADMMRPWRSIEVGTYLPLVEWAITKPFDIAAARLGRNETERNLIRMDADDIATIRPAVREATQKCLYDLGASWAANPYVALAMSVATVTAAKTMAVSVVRKREKSDARERSAPIPGAVVRPHQPRQHQAARPFITPRDSSTANGREAESGDGFSSVAHPEAVNQNFSLDEYGDALEQ